MSINPFSPAFSTVPKDFFGRRSYIDRYRVALRTPNSPDRFFFLLGTSGCGKTSLLHQYVAQAIVDRWEVLEVTGMDALNRLVYYAWQGTQATAKPDSESEEQRPDPALELSTLSDQIAQILSRRSPRGPRGALLIAIDETQEADQEDIERVCNVVQTLRTQGFDISLILSGMPLSHPRITSFSRCVFVNRMQCIRLGCMSRIETVRFLRENFGRIPEARISDQQIAALANHSHGHPYLMQLVGDITYHLVHSINDNAAYVLTNEDISWVCEEALRRYRTDILSHILVGIPDETIEYLRAVTSLRDRATGLAEINRVNEKVSSPSAFVSALDTQIVDCPKRGYLRLTIPFFDYAFADPVSMSLSAHPAMGVLDDWVF